jgi:hypothetical protein
MLTAAFFLAVHRKHGLNSTIGGSFVPSPTGRNLPKSAFLCVASYRLALAGMSAMPHRMGGLSDDAPPRHGEFWRSALKGAPRPNRAVGPLR